jgi:hypothetical protein
LCSHGIIIKKHFPKRLKISILDESYGHIGVVPASWQWASYASAGTVIGYDLYSEHDTYFIKNIELVTVPVYKNESAMLYLHHVLEICYFCLPVHGGQHDCFQLVLYIINILEHIAHTPAAQKILLAKLLFLIGQYPHDVERLAISTVLHKNCDQLLELSLDRDGQKELELFIYQCVQSHPYGRLLRTVHFLSQVGR